jgi:4-hydroxybenzoate polyprenyltransferase
MQPTGSWRSYVELARVDHWFKNIFVLPGIVIAFLLEPATRGLAAIPGAALGLLATCLIASSNYVLNEILDAGTDRFHPSKKNRPMVAGTLSVRLAWAEWLGLAVVGFALGAWISRSFLASLAALWIMALIYNVPPVRSKEVAYLDVLSEAINNPIRLLLGWFAVGAAGFPPSSFLLSYWLIGAYLMTAKRLSEYRGIADRDAAGRYRSSFRYYSEPLLSAVMLTYAAGFMFFFGVLMVKYHIEYILAFPLFLIYLAYYTHLTYLPDSVAQNPEKLYRDRTLMVFTVILVAAVWTLTYTKLPRLGLWLGVDTVAW